MSLLERKECMDELEALKVERELIEQNNATLNSHKPYYRTQKDWNEKHRKQNEKVQQDRKEHPETYGEIDRQAYLKNRDNKILWAKHKSKKNKEWCL